MESEHYPETPPLKRRRVLAVRPTPVRLSDLLASFKAVKYPEYSTWMQRQAAGRELRMGAAAVNYAESDGASSQASPNSQSSFEDPDSSRTSMLPDSRDDSSEDELNDDNITVSRPKATPTRELPARSTRSYTSYGRPQVKKRKPAKKRAIGKVLLSDANSAGKELTTRSQIRNDIFLHTKPRRDAYLLSRKAKLLHVLPERNYIARLEAESSTSDLPDIVEVQSLAQPEGVKAVLKSYQLEGLAFLKKMHQNGMPAILGDEMGLGKTLQTLSMFQYLAESEPKASESRPHLVVCPLSVLSSWMKETRAWTPGLKIVRFHGPKTERESLKKELGQVSVARKVDIIVTSYQTFKAEAGWLKRAFAWRYCVLDEGHLIKNHDTQVAKALFSIQAEHRLLLTGTPLQNNLKEMWSLLHWLLPEVFTLDTLLPFKEAFDISNGKVSSSFLDAARELLEELMLRRTKRTVDLGLPPKEEVMLYVPLTPVQKQWYKRVLARMDNATLTELFEAASDAATLGEQNSVNLTDKTNELLGDPSLGDDVSLLCSGPTQEENGTPGTGRYQKLMNLMLQLQRVCCHPYLLKQCLPQPYILGDHIKRASGKFLVLDKLVDELVVRQHKKILIFSGWTAALDVTEDLLAQKGANSPNASFRYLRLDGSTSRAHRNLGIRMFNDPNSEFRIMLISTKAGGLGLNLPAAKNVVFLDTDWNPQNTLQAEARSHRIGQTEKVTVYKIVAQGTVDEQMQGRIRKKLYLSCKVTENMRNLHTANSLIDGVKRKHSSIHNTSEEDEPSLGAGELRTLLRKGAQTLIHEDVDLDDMLGWDFNTMLEKCKEKEDAAPGGEPAAVSESEEQSWLSTMERVETAVFEGKRYERQKQQEKDQAMELSRADRRVGKNTTVMVDGFAINKESMNCADWEAVPTMAGKDPRLAELKKEKKAAIRSQDYCQECWEGGALVCCSGCPRTYHVKCLDQDFKAKTRGPMNFYCPQHQCYDCEAKTGDAGGMIYRCRWCSKGYCEDCLDWDNTHLIGDSLPEYEMAGFGAVAQAWYIECPGCTRSDNYQALQAEAAEIQERYDDFLQRD